MHLHFIAFMEWADDIGSQSIGLLRGATVLSNLTLVFLVSFCDEGRYLSSKAVHT